MDVDLASFEFARAYVQARRHQTTGAVRIPVVKDERGKLVAVGRPVEWAPGVAAKVITKRYAVQLLETADCYRLLSSTKFETLTHHAPSPEKKMAPGHLTRQRSSTIFERMRSGVSEDRGEVPYMEDGHIHLPDLASVPGVPRMLEKQSFFAVIDGHGGGACRDFITKHIVHAFVQHEGFFLDPATALTAAFESTDQKFLAESEGDTSGATCICLFVRGSHLWIASVGDCRAVVSKQGTAVALTTDHKPQDQAERTRIEAAGGTVEFGCLNGDLRVSRAIGDRDKSTGQKMIGLTATPEVSEVVLGPGDEFVVAATDGLWDVMKNEQVVELARSEMSAHGDVSQSCEKVVIEALNRHTEDNICVLIISFFSEEHLQRIQAQRRESSKAWRPRRRQGVNVDRMLQELREADEAAAEAEM